MPGKQRHHIGVELGVGQIVELIAGLRGDRLGDLGFGDQPAADQVAVEF